jgi:hypothetical protein
MDRERKLFCIVRENSTDDTELTLIVSEMRDLGMPIHCDTPEISRSVEEIIAGWRTQGYTSDPHLYSNALQEKRRRELAKKRDSQTERQN